LQNILNVVVVDKRGVVSHDGLLDQVVFFVLRFVSILGRLYYVVAQAVECQHVLVWLSSLLLQICATGLQPQEGTMQHSAQQSCKLDERAPYHE